MIDAKKKNVLFSDNPQIRSCIYINATFRSLSLKYSIILFI